MNQVPADHEVYLTCRFFAVNLETEMKFPCNPYGYGFDCFVTRKMIHLCCPQEGAAGCHLDLFGAR